MSETRSPLRERLLHVPGQSLDETINRLWDDRGVMYAMAMAAFVCVALVDWYRWLTHVPLRPWVTTVWAAVVTAYSIRGLVRLRKQTKLLEQGRDGERAVAEVLEAVREQGGRVFHDIVGEGFNVDHVVLSTRGVFVIETKTLSKPRGGTIKVEGRQIIAGGANLGAKPIEQAETNARWVRDFLKQSTGKGHPVKPCLVFPC